jgi:hypothetical protein
MDKPGNSDENWSDILESLTRMRNKLIEINEKSGHIANYVAMRREITELGWDGILAKYHPDVNINDPAVWPLFELYRFIRDGMDRR